MANQISRFVPTHLDKCLQPAVVAKNRKVNVRLPEDGADVRRNA